MTELTATASAGWRMKVAIGALVLSLFCVAWFMAAALGTKFGLWSWQFGLGQMTFSIGPKLALFAVVVGLVSQVISLIKAPRFQPALLSLVATLIAALVMLRLMGMGEQAAALPPIHDVQTDWQDPIQFSDALMAARTADGEVNPVVDEPRIIEAADARWPGMGGRLVSEVQEEAETKSAGKGTVLPPMQPIYFDASPRDVAVLIENQVNKSGWQLVTPAPADTTSPDGFQIEATATSGWFGFKDDVAIRVQPVDGALKVDMRSTSRVGLSDLGANSRRVSAFMLELQDRGNGRPAP